MNLRSSIILYLAKSNFLTSTIRLHYVHNHAVSAKACMDHTYCSSELFLNVQLIFTFIGKAEISHLLAPPLNGAVFVRGLPGVLGVWQHLQFSPVPAGNGSAARTEGKFPKQELTLCTINTCHILLLLLKTIL